MNRIADCLSRVHHARNGYGVVLKLADARTAIMGGSLRIKGENSKPKCAGSARALCSRSRRKTKSSSSASSSKPAGAGYAAARLEVGLGKGEGSSRPTDSISPPPPEASGSKPHVVAKTATELKHDEVKRKRVRQLRCLPIRCLRPCLARGLPDHKPTAS